MRVRVLCTFNIISLSRAKSSIKLQCGRNGSTNLRTSSLQSKSVNKDESLDIHTHTHLCLINVEWFVHRLNIFTHISMINHSMLITPSALLFLGRMRSSNCGYTTTRLIAPCSAPCKVVIIGFCRAQFSLVRRLYIACVFAVVKFSKKLPNAHTICSAPSSLTSLRSSAQTKVRAEWKCCS